jgi:CRP/FNR family transcriptional regulator, nitrogen fixation regulation protein
MLTQSVIQARNPSPDIPSLDNRTAARRIESMGFSVSYPSNAEIYGDQEQAKYLYKVVRGTVRSSKILEDGRRQIAAFYVPGDVFGLEWREHRTLSAEAVGLCKLLLLKRSTVAALAERESEIARELWTLTAAELQRVQDHSLLLTKSALTRVAGFLLEMAERFCNEDEVELPMGRQDIADYLALTVETVSRSLTHLEDIAAIEMLSRRRIVLRNHAALVHLGA